MPLKLTTLVLDTGGMLIKTIRWPAGEFAWQPWESRQLALNGIDRILLTGGRRAGLKPQLARYRVETVPELEALGQGAANLTDLDHCWVIGLGTGTPILQVERNNHQVRHVIGTGVGAGTLWGLGQQLVGDFSPIHLDQLAGQGDPTQYNMTVGDIYPNPDQLGLPKDLTAGNFAKIARGETISIQNVASALFQLVGEVVATVAAAAIGMDRQPVVLAGGGTLYPHLIRVIQDTLNFYGLESVVPEKALYATAWGALVLKDLV